MALNKTFLCHCLALGGWLLAASCGGNSSSTNAPASSETCMFDAQQFCEKRKTCWPDGVNDYRFQRDWGNLQTCINERWRSCVEDVERPMSGNTVARVSSCARALMNQSCQDFLAGIALPTSDCPPIVGHIDNAAACAVGDQCKSNYCDRAENQRCGKCADKRGIGASCDQNSDCASPLTCQPSADGLTMACAMLVPTTPPPKAKAGEACGTGLPGCDSGLVCVGMGLMKTCMAQVATEGAPSDPARTKLPDCDNTTDHLWCNTAKLTSEKRLWAPVGQTCGVLAMEGSFAGCSAGANCVVAKDAMGKRTTTGVCIADAIEGEPCWRNTADGPACAVPLRCIYDAVGAPNGVCVSADYNMCSLPVPMRDGGLTSAPDAGGTTPSPDAGGSTPSPDAGGSTPSPDAGATGG
jgi:hypothetical protein